jgi:hypothetical protein
MVRHNLNLFFPENSSHLKAQVEGKMQAVLAILIFTCFRNLTEIKELKNHITTSAVYRQISL